MYVVYIYVHTYVRNMATPVDAYDVKHNNQKATDRAIAISEQSRQGI